MTSLDIRIELPAYSHSFAIQVEQWANIANVKHEIAKSCPGNPRPDGQRLIYKGHFLADEERILDIWKSPDDARILHLAVHPSAWTSNPPSLSSSSPMFPASSAQIPTSVRPASEQAFSQYLRAHTPLLASSSNMSLNYVNWKHHVALQTLLNGVSTLDTARMTDPDWWRSVAVQHLHLCGWSWPSVLDEEYPSAENSGEGLKYEQVIGLPYLSLATPDAAPTPIQTHALKVLSVTFTILTAPSPELPPLPIATSYSTPYPINAQTDLNEHLQQLGLPPIRLAAGQNFNPNLHVNDPNHLPGAVAAPAVEIRAIPLRALMVPLIMLVFRTLLLLYFFSPMKRPFFALLLSAWILYEAWGTLRVVIGDGRVRNPRAVDLNGRVDNNGRQGPADRRDAGASYVANRGQMQALLNGLSNLNLHVEDAVLDGGLPVRPPSLGHKVKTFVSLMLLTLHPAVWDYRRAALRRREGRLRTEANIREAAMQNTDGQNAAGSPGERTEDETRVKALIEAHERRPTWVKEYVHRVQTTDWADDV
ncbi:uncharacterized protein FIBRA_07054 [Fibroporia radiculosa]|uniref:Ubiquitin-like domain-containing protein n=1 Tax=Fibroporia radiculosa TaxID=599839 RepID=J4IBL3_9APHY|nr:uncharacterized protein FIBRA_07054 [Fibroporia radiculosa]CCM04861.1 predicted protein [Fibroporia radiculosa]